MKTITTIIIIFISASLQAQKDYVTSDWVVVAEHPIAFTDSAWSVGNWLSIEFTEQQYDSVKVQFRRNFEGVIMQRQRFYYTK